MNGFQLNSKQLTCFELGKSWIVLKHTSSSLHVLSALDMWILYALDEHLSQQEIITTLEKEGAEQSVIDQHYAYIQKLLEDDENSTGTYAQEYAFLSQSAPSTPSVKTQCSFDFLGKRINIISDDEPFFQDCMTLFANQPRFSRFIQSTDTNFQFSLTRKADDYQLYCNDHLLFDIAEYCLIMPILMDSIQIISYQFSDYLLGIHSAMLVKNNNGLMLPGLSGSGKSTLCASLLKQGYTCYSDELALLSLSTSKLMPMPLPMALKSGSWDVMAVDFPEMDKLPIWERADGRRSKYIELPHTIDDLPEAKVKCIIFPHYHADRAQCELIPLDSVSALKGLTRVGYQIKQDLTIEKVEQLLRWIAGISAYELHYANLDDAHRIIDSLMD
jgi:hypothetical protein